MAKNHRVTCVALVVILSGSMMLAACDNNTHTALHQAPEVGVMTLKSTSLTITTDLPGRTSPFRIAEIRPQVSGIILKRNFTEGSEIKAGESLYQIDPATYKADYDKAKGDLAQAQANAQVAAMTLKRYKTLLHTHYISQQDYDNASGTAAQTAAAVKIAQAAVESARINLAYTKVKSPIDGRIGKSSVTEGALVNSGQASPLSTVQQLDPIYVDVTQPSSDYIRLRRQLEEGKIKQQQGKAQVKLITQDSKEYSQLGTLEFSDVTVDQTTGSITLRAIFPNPQHHLLPGMFVRARLEEGTNPDALLVPQQAVTRTPAGQATTMVVGTDNKVTSRIIKAEQAIGDKWLVTSGLKNGDRVIVTGLQRVKPGMQVEPKEMGGQAQNNQSSPAKTPSEQSK